jgi:hypothetical protein
MKTLKYQWRGHRIEIFREGTHYTIVIDDHIRDGGWPRTDWAKTAARNIINCDLCCLDPERTGELK